MRWEGLAAGDGAMQLEGDVRTTDAWVYVSTRKWHPERELITVSRNQSLFIKALSAHQRYKWIIEIVTGRLTDYWDRLKLYLRQANHIIYIQENLPLELLTKTQWKSLNRAIYPTADSTTKFDCIQRDGHEILDPKKIAEIYEFFTTVAEKIAKTICEEHDPSKLLNFLAEATFYLYLTTLNETVMLISNLR